MISSDAKFWMIKLWVLLGKPEPIPTRPIVPKPQSIYDDLVVPVADLEDEDDVEEDAPKEHIVVIAPKGDSEEGQVVENIAVIVLEAHT